MNHEHDERHAELIERLVTGAPPLEAAERRQLESCDACRSAAQEFAQLERGLRRLADEDRALLAASEGGDDLPGADVIRQFALERRREAVRASDARRRPLRWAWFASAAALLIVTALWRWSSSRKELDYDQTLGAEPLIELVEDAPGAGYSEFRWSGPLQTGGRFEIEVRQPAAGDEPARPLLPQRARVYGGEAWSPSEELTSKWPDQIEWRVLSCDSDGKPWARSEFSRRRR